MALSKLFELANASGGTLYLMALLLLAALTVIIERSLFLANMQRGGDALIRLLHDNVPPTSEAAQVVLKTHAKLPHVNLFEAARLEPATAGRDVCSGHLEEVLMREVPSLDRSLWVLDTVITLAPLLGLFGTIIGMFSAFSVLGDVQNGASQVTGGIAEALIATASGLFIAMVGLVFFNGLNTKVRVILHQMETIKLMLLNRRFGGTAAHSARGSLKAV
jgi:biopolymer transport protein ExbB